MGSFTTYFHPISFALDTIVAIVCGFPVTGLILWVGRIFQRRTSLRAG